jgi:hypothetical protein
MAIVSTLANRVSKLKKLDLTRVIVATPWLVRQVTPLKK